MDNIICIFNIAILSILIILVLRKCTIKKCSFKDTIESIGLPIVSFHQNNNDFYFLIDTGSDGSVLNNAFINELQYEDLNTERDIYGIDGNLIKTNYVAAEFCLHGKSFIEAFQVMPIPGLDKLSADNNIKIVGILGSSFLKRYGFILNYKNMQMQYKNKCLWKKQP